MQYDIDGGNITVIVGEEVRIDVPTALNYIKSGQAEIGAAVDAGIEAFDLNAANKTTAYDNNASAKLAAYNDNATDKLNAFDLNASGKTTDFNDNYTLKKAAVDASADAAAASATLAQQWAIKMDGKVADEDYSAKYYADLASQAAGATGANIDLSNLSPTGEAKFEAKQDVIDADHKLSYNYLSDTPDLSAYVTTNTAQTITGTKTFTQDVVMQKSVTKGTVPENSVYYDIKFVDSNNEVMGIVETRVGDNGDVYTALGACKNESGSSAAEVITVHYPANGNPYTSAPTPTDTTTTSGTQIATTGWVNSVGNNVMHLTDYETYTGVKSLRIAVNLNQESYRNTNDFQITNLDQTVAPQYNQSIYTNIVRDKNDNYISWITTKYSTTRETTTTLSSRCKNSNNTANVTCDLHLIANPNGTTYATVPASDVANSIITTVNKSKAANGYFQLGNGLIIQWGRTKVSVITGASETPVTTITLPKAFTTTNYSLTGTFESNTSTSASDTDDVTFCTTSISTTSVKGFGYDAGGNTYDAYLRWIAIGY